MNRAVAHYTRRYLFKNKKRVVSDIVCLFLCLCSAVILSVSAWSYLASTQKYDLQQNGAQDVVYKNVTAQEVEQVQEHRQDASLGVAEVFGRQPIAGSAYSEYAVLGSLDKQAVELAHIALLEGAWPSQSGEVVLEKSLKYKLGLTVGQSYVFRVSMLGTDHVVEVPCTITGVCNDFSKSQSGAVGDANLEDVLPNVLTVRETFAPLLGGEEPVRHLLVAFAQLGQDTDFAALFAQWTGRENVSFHSKYAPAQGLPMVTYSDSNKLSTTYIFVILLSVSGFVIFVSLLLNVAMNKKRNSRDIFQLKLAGASVRDIRRFFLLRESACFLIALPLALLTAIGVLFWFQKGVMEPFWELFSIQFHPLILFAVIACVYCLTLLSILISTGKGLARLPLEAEEKEETYRPILNKTLSFKNPAVLWAFKSFLKNGKRSRAGLCLLSLCVTLVVAGTVLSAALVRDLKEEYMFDYKMQGFDGGYLSVLEVPFTLSYGVSERDWQKVKSLDEAAFVTASKQWWCKLVTTDKTGYPAKDFFFGDYETDDLDALRKDKEYFGYQSDEYLAPSRISGVEDNVLEILEPYITAGSFDKAGLDSGEKLIVLRDNPRVSYYVGQKLRFTQSILKNTQGDIMQMYHNGATRYDREFEVCAIVDMTRIHDESLLEMFQSIRSFAIPNRAFDVFPFATNYCNLYVKLKDPNVSAQTDAVFAQLKSIYPNAQIISQQGETQRLNLLVTVTQSVLQLVNVVIALFAFMSLYNMIQKRIAEQARSIAMLRSIGFGKWKVFLSQYAELCLLSIGAVLFGYLLSLPIHVLFYRHALFSAYPWYLLFSCLLLLFSVSAAIVWFALRPVYKKSVVAQMSAL